MGLGRRDFMRVDFPAARMMAVVGIGEEKVPVLSASAERVPVPGAFVPKRSTIN
jgi:hypothetical protein